MEALGFPSLNSHNISCSNFQVQNVSKNPERTHYFSSLELSSLKPRPFCYSSSELSSLKLRPSCGTPLLHRTAVRMQVDGEDYELKQMKDMAAARKRWEALVREEKVKVLTPREAGYAIQLSNKTLLDVRPSIEHKKAWVKGSRWIPIFDVDTKLDVGTLSRKITSFMMGGWWSGMPTLSYNDQFLPKVQENYPKDTDLIVACQKGLRSLAACELLYNAGYRNLFWVQGGLEAAEEEDLVIEGPQPLKFAGIGGVSELEHKILRRNMEMSLTSAASPSRSMCFNHGALHPKSPVVTIKKIATGNATGSGRRRRRRSPVSAIKALNSSSSKQTLSSNWDISQDYSAISAPWLPSFEELDTTNMLLRQRIIFLGSQVDDMTADLIISQLLFLDAEDSKKDIKLFINSPGGSVTAGMGIYDAMKLCKADVSTVCLGLAASMGAFILASGAKGKRFCMPNARVMIHQPLGTAGGKATEMGIRIREMAYHKIKLNKIFSRITGKPLEQIEADTDRDNFMNPWVAKEYGLIDAVIDDGKPGLVAPIADATPPPKTRVWDLWKVEGSRKAKKNLPSEHKILESGYKGGQGDGEGDAEQEKQASTPV